METTIFFENNFIFILLFIEYLKSYFPIHLSFFFVLMWQNILYEILASETTIVLLKYFFISPIGCGTTVSDSDKEILVIVTLKWQLFSPRKNIKRKCCKWNFFFISQWNWLSRKNVLGQIRTCANISSHVKNICHLLKAGLEHTGIFRYLLLNYMAPFWEGRSWIFPRS